VVREGRHGRRYRLPYPCRRTAAGWIEQWNAADRQADNVEAVHSQP
jgi:hypothetical protein